MVPCPRRYSVSVNTKEGQSEKYPWIDEYLMAKRGVTKDLQAEWNWIRYHIGGKMFAAVLLDDNDRPYYINLKLEPMEGELMRQQYPDIIPGYYSNKQHWNSVKTDGEIPDDLLKHWLDRSCELRFLRQRSLWDLAGHPRSVHDGRTVQEEHRRPGFRTEELLRSKGS